MMRIWRRLAASMALLAPMATGGVPGCGKVVAATAVVTVTAGFGSCNESSQIMRRYRYTEVSPPSNLFQPGSLVAISHRKPFTAALVCGPRASLGADLEVHHSATASAMAQRMNGMNQRLAASYVDSIRLDGRFSTVSSVQMQLNNPRIVEVNDTDVIDGVKKRNDSCKRAIEARIQRGYAVTMIQSALSGDVTFRVGTKSEAQMDAKAKLDMMSQLAFELGGGTTSVSETEIRSQDMIWGVRDSSYLASFGISDDTMPTPTERPPEDSSYLLAATNRAYILPVPDAPVVPPANYRKSLDGYEDVEENNIRLYRQPTRIPRYGAPIFDPRRAPLNYLEDDDSQRSQSL